MWDIQPFYVSTSFPFTKFREGVLLLHGTWGEARARHGNVTLGMDLPSGCTVRSVQVFLFRHFLEPTTSANLGRPLRRIWAAGNSSPLGAVTAHFSGPRPFPSSLSTCTCCVGHCLQGHIRTLPFVSSGTQKAHPNP